LNTLVITNPTSVNNIQQDPTFHWSSQPPSYTQPNNNYIPLPILDNLPEPIQSFNLNNLQPTQYEIGDFVLRKYVNGKLGPHNPNKWGAFWRGPYLITSKSNNIYNNVITYFIRNLITDSEYPAHIADLKPFYYDPKYVDPYTIALRSAEEFVVGAITDHAEDPISHLMYWKVHWRDFDDSEDSWEPFDNLKDVLLFQTYCRQHGLIDYLPKRKRLSNKDA
jgi:hypothetical protein